MDSDSDREEKFRESEITEYLQTKMVVGKSVTAQIHLIHPDDDSKNTWVRCRCKARPFRASADFKIAQKMQSLKNKACPTCMSNWPKDIAEHIFEK